MKLLLQDNFSRNKPLGFTLIEMLITVAVIGIIGLSVGPSLSDLQAKQRRVTEVNKILGAIRFTRNLAIQHHQVATFCPTDDNISCNRNWNLPFIIFVDKNNDRIRQVDELLLKQIPAISKQDNLQWKAFRNSNSLQFLPSGITSHQNGTFVYCPKKNRSDLARGIMLTKMGRARLSKDTNNDGIQEGAGNKKLICS